MKLTSVILFILSITAITYGYWGAFTNAGNKVYDEMDGYYPFFILIAGVVLFLIFLIIFFLWRKRSKKH